MSNEDLRTQMASSSAKIQRHLKNTFNKTLGSGAVGTKSVQRIEQNEFHLAGITSLTVSARKNNIPLFGVFPNPTNAILPIRRIAQLIDSQAE